MKTIYKNENLPKISLPLLFCLINSLAVGAGWENGQCTAATAKKKTATKPAAATGVTLSTPEPRTPIEHNNRGCELGMKGLWAAAIHEHELALNADPENTQFRVNLSSAQMLYARQLAGKGKIYEAMTHYREALYVDSC